MNIDYKVNIITLILFLGNILFPFIKYSTKCLANYRRLLSECKQEDEYSSEIKMPPFWSTLDYVMFKGLHKK